MVEILTKFGRPMRELTLIIVGAVPTAQVVPAQLVLEFEVVGARGLLLGGVEGVFVVVVGLLFGQGEVLVVGVGVAGGGGFGLGGAQIHEGLGQIFGGGCD